MNVEKSGTNERRECPNCSNFLFEFIDAAPDRPAKNVWSCIMPGCYSGPREGDSSMTVYVPLTKKEHNLMLQRPLMALDYSFIANTLVSAAPDFIRDWALVLSQIESTNRSILTLIKDPLLDNHYESCLALLRLLLESAFHIAVITQDYPFDKFPARGDKTIRRGLGILKPQIPNLGKMWGLANEFAHGRSESSIIMLAKPVTETAITEIVEWKPKLLWTAQDLHIVQNCFEGTLNILHYAFNLLLDKTN